MMASIIKESIVNLDPEKINFDDKESVKELTIALLNTIEHLVQENAKLREENQQLKDEIAQLKGEKGKPKIRPNVPAREPFIPKPKSKGWSKGSKKDKVKVDRQGKGRSTSYDSSSLLSAVRRPFCLLPKSANPRHIAENR